MFQRTFLGPNGPMDLFFEVYAQDEAEVDLVASTILRLPRRRVHVERWGAPIMERLRTDHRVTVCADAPRRHEKCVEADTKKGRSGDLKAMISKARKVELGWRMLEAHVAAGRGGVDYDACSSRADLSYPPQPFDMARAAAADALLVPVGADMPLNDQLAVGRPRWLRAYATAYSHCASSGAARALYGKAVPIGDHFCGKLERSLVPAIRSRVPDDKFRRFWFQYWIVRGYQIPYFEEHHDFAYRTWGSPCCWQRLNWAQPAMSLSVLVDLNTTCLVDPNVLGKHDKNSVRWPQGGSRPRAAAPREVFAREGHGVARPPGGGNATVVRFGAVDESGLRVAGRGWGRVVAKWRCAKQMKIAVLGGSMTCGGNLAKRHNDKTKAWPARLLAKLRSSLGAGVALHNACEPASSLGWCVSLLSTHVPPGTDIVVVDYSQNDNRPTIEDAREGGAAVDELVSVAAEAFLVALAKLAGSRREPPPAVLFLTTILPPKFHQPTTAPALKGWRALWADPARAAAYGAVLQGHARIYDRVARFHGASSFALQDHDGLWPAGEFLGNARLDRLWRAPAAKGGDVDHHPGVPAHEFVADAAHAAVLALVRRAERGDGAVVPDWAPAGGTLASANELAELSACSLGMAAHLVAADVEAAASPGAQVRAGGGWSLRRDRPDKPPGWIVNATATATSELSIVVPCGHTGTVGLEYLRSYEGMGRDRDAESLAVVRQFKVACHNHAMVWNPVVVKLRPDPGDRGKFKLLSIFTC
ncbi:hypothetical protein JL720_11781 [Aureococcus anophagefferens]|nr:hypothetical protein JL720_11781 [Aureococcus anophagefferens]